VITVYFQRQAHNETTVIIGRSCTQEEGKSYPVQASTGPELFQEIEAPKISRQSEHEGGKIVSTTHRPTLPVREYSWHSFMLQAESIPGS